MRFREHINVLNEAELKITYVLAWLAVSYIRIFALAFAICWLIVTFAPISVSIQTCSTRMNRLEYIIPARKLACYFSEVP